MVQLVDPARSGLGPGISALSQALGAGLERRRKTQQQSALLNALSQASKGRQAPPSGQAGQAGQAQEGGVLGRTLSETPLPEPSGSALGPRFNTQQTLAATMIDPNLGKVFVEQNKAVDERAKEERVSIAKYAAPYENISSISSDLNRLQEAKRLIESGRVALDGNMIRNLSTAILEDRGAESVAEFFKTDEQKRIFSLLKPFFKVKDLGGSNPSTREVLLTLATLPGRMVGRESNLKMINAMIADQASILEKAQTSDALMIKGDYSFPEFKRIVEDRGLKRFNEETEKLGAPTRAQPGAGKPLDERAINLIIDEVGTDRAKILKRAQELGYKVT